MTSERRAAAARANGAKSRGPVTAQGKANSARNSLRHGLRAKFPFNDGKFESERQAILAGLASEFKPQSEIERCLVELIANAHWARKRIWRLETELFNTEMRRLERAGEDCAAAAAFRSLADHTCALELLVRFESRYSRLYRRALDHLYRIQDTRSTQPQSPVVNERTHQMSENKGTAKKRTEPEPAASTPDQRLAASVRQSFVDSPTEIPAKCAQAL